MVSVVFSKKTEAFSPFFLFLGFHESYISQPLHSNIDFFSHELITPPASSHDSGLKLLSHFYNSIPTSGTKVCLSQLKCFNLDSFNNRNLFVTILRLESQRPCIYLLSWILPGLQTTIILLHPHTAERKREIISLMFLIRHCLIHLCSTLMI